MCKKRCDAFTTCGDNGRCNDAGVCECDAGFVISRRTGRCEPAAAAAAPSRPPPRQDTASRRDEERRRPERTQMHLQGRASAREITRFPLPERRGDARRERRYPDDDNGAPIVPSAQLEHPASDKPAVAALAVPSEPTKWELLWAAALQKGEAVGSVLKTVPLALLVVVPILLLLFVWVLCCRRPAEYSEDGFLTEPLLAVDNEDAPPIVVYAARPRKR
jgi:hypothetical protein